LKRDTISLSCSASWLNSTELALICSLPLETSTPAWLTSATSLAISAETDELWATFSLTSPDRRIFYQHMAMALSATGINMLWSGRKTIRQRLIF
jgi:hypothetical protein